MREISIFITITSFGTNTLSLSRCVLHVSTREKLETIWELFFL